MHTTTTKLIQTLNINIFYTIFRTKKDAIKASFFTLKTEKLFFVTGGTFGRASFLVFFLHCPVTTTTALMSSVLDRQHFAFFLVFMAGFTTFRSSLMIPLVVTLGAVHFVFTVFEINRRFFHFTGFNYDRLRGRFRHSIHKTGGSQKSHSHKNCKNLLHFQHLLNNVKI